MLSTCIRQRWRHGPGIRTGPTGESIRRSQGKKDTQETERSMWSVSSRHFLVSTNLKI